MASPDHHSAPDPVTPHRPRVAVVFGGRSSEHTISCLTAAGVLRALDHTRYDVVALGIAPDGRWVLVPDDPQALQLQGSGRPVVAGDGPGVVVPTSTADRSLIALEPGRVPQVLGTVDVVFPLLHGPYGEDGTLQGLLELGDVPYVGSGVLASAASMDKHLMKVLLAGHGLAVGPYQVVTPRQWRLDRDGVLHRLASLGLPVFVKPARAGSSIGITRVDEAAELAAAVDAAAKHDPKVVVEAAIVGRELECGVLQDLDGTPRASELGEIEVVSGHAFYDYEAKYFDAGSVRLTTPAQVPDDVRDRVQRIAVEAFEVMGCEGLARVDVFYTSSGEIVVNELNTMPGFTEQSMYPRMWAASGVDYPTLVDRLVQLALRRPTGLR
ncbi:MAG: D-alanine--D-alanine ligase family protein [Angustibacter sp.]